MSREACVAAVTVEPNHLRASEVGRCPATGCFCETVSVSEHSPHEVRDEEEIHVLVRDPNHLLPDGKLHPGLFAGILTRGLSCLRGAALDGEFHLTAEAMLEGDEEDFFIHGVGSTTAGAVRYPEGNRQFLVLDTGYADRPHHSDIFLRMADGLSETQKKKKYKLIRDNIGLTIAGVSDFRGGALSKYARP